MVTDVPSEAELSRFQEPRRRAIPSASITYTVSMAIFPFMPIRA
jgi:hypothetical protein